MPIIKPQGLQGLKGLGSLSKQDYDAFVERNKELISRNGYDPIYINNLYSNKQFIDRYGVEKFKAIPDINMRNNLLREDVVNEEWNNLYGGMDDGWKQKYGMMSMDAKQKLLESNWLSPTEFEKNWKDEMDTYSGKQTDENGNTYFLPNPIGSTVPMGAVESARNSEAERQRRKERNDRVLEHIYNDDAENMTKIPAITNEVANVYQELAQSLNDEQIIKKFKTDIVPGSYEGNMGIPEYASHIDSSEMENFSVDEMREVLAKKQVYEQYMSPDMAATALNNDAKRYIKDNQGSWKRLGLFGKDVGISALSYTADKVNGLYNLGLMVADAVGDKPVVWVDDTGNIVDASTIATEQGGKYVYGLGADGKYHPVHQIEIDRTTLHNMGKNTNGSDNTSILNPQYWTRAEQFGTLDEDLQKKYEKIGSSPYKVTYNPNEDSDLLYESFKMMSFGLADGASQFIPFGVGMLGKTLSTANKIGRVGRGIGEALNWSGKMLTAQSRTGQLIQGGAGALGIAYAYQRGSFQETLAENLANAEETVMNRSKQAIYDQYQNDDEYKGQIDKLVDARAAILKAEYIAQLGEGGKNRIVDEEALDEMIRARAQQAVLGEMVQQKYQELKGTQEYADLQEEAINSAGETAVTTFLPEAIKYGLVNTIGFRKWMYTNPTGVTNKVSAGLKGLREITTPAGRQRLTTEASKFLTLADKWKQMGKTIGSQVWGGAWTNGTDDMMVDAAERINADSFGRYLQAYENGESLADTYGFADGLYSYWKGLNNSLGQETTWNAATVGGLGSILSFTPNMANIAHLATKEGRQAYRDNFQRRAKRNEDGSVMRDEQGNIQYEEIGRVENWRDRLNYFIQNGVLNTYYGAKQNERDLQNHADYVNNLLDDYDDFRVIEELITSDIALDDAETVGDQKTMRYVKAINAINALNQLAKNENDPTTLSSVVQNAKQFIAKAAEMSMDADAENAFTEDEVNNMLAQYYSQNPGVPQSEANNQAALYQISQNAQKLQEASEAYDQAEKEIQKIEKNLGKSIDPAVRAKMKMNQALDGHWRNRVQQMQQEIDDSSEITGEVSQGNLLATVGGKKNAESLVRVYNKQEAELEKELIESKEATAKKQEAFDIAKINREQAKSSDEVYRTQQALDKVQAELSDAQQQEEYVKGLITRTQEKRKQVEEALAAAQQQQTEQGTATVVDKVLTADEIFGLDPVTRARMLHPDNRSLYSESQQKEIRKLEQRLLMRDADALQKIQDIARLSQRIAVNEDAYGRMAQNPEAAAVQLEAQRAQAADAAYKLINQRNAEQVADFINQFEEGVKGHSEVSQEQKEIFVTRTLRKMSPTLLDIIDEDSLLPQYQQQVADAKEWGSVVADIDAVVNNAEENQGWKDNVSKAIANAVETANNRDEIMTNLEKVIDDTAGSQTAQDFEKVLNGLEQLGYQRDATVIENRKQRKQREEAEAKRKKEAEEDAKIAAAEAQAAAQKKAADIKAAQEQITGDEQTGEDAIPLDTSTIVDEGEETAVTVGKGVFGNIYNHLKGKAKEAIDFLKKTKEGVVKAALNHPAIGDIDIAWGNKSLGLEHIITKHPEVTDNLQDIIGSMKVVSQSDNRIVLESDTHRAIVSNNWYGEKVDSWLLTAYGKKNGASGESIDIVPEPNKGKQNGTAPLQDTNNSEGKITNNSENGQENSENNDTFVSQNNHLVDNGEIMEGKSPSVDEQFTEGEEVELKETFVSENNTDVSAANGTGEHVIETSATSLSGNAMSEWQPDPLKKEGLLVHKQGAKPDDSMSKYYAWMKAAGIKLQNIIDQELGEILRQNPHAKVKFMTIRPEDNATHDRDMQSHLMLVLDYDNSINRGIASIHRTENGGVIESQGKKYLVIGTVGYNRGNLGKMALYDVLFSNNPRGATGYGLVKRGAGEFWRSHPEERFYVPERLSTEIVPKSLIPGYRVRQMETDEVPQYRSVREILEDPERNPHGMEMQDLAWGIQELTKFLVVGANLNDVMVPRNATRNSGSAFMLMPAANGKMIPAYLKPLFYNEMREGQLKSIITQLLNDVVSPDYATRLEAVVRLTNLLHLDTQGENFLLGKDDSSRKNQVSLVKDGKTFRTFVLNDTFDRQEFMAAVAEMNPRVNITKSVFQSNALLRQYDEAGALDTDIALLNTAGSSYSIYGLDAQGNMLLPEVANNDIPRTGRNSDFRNGDKTQVPYKHRYYNYDTNEGRYYLNGIPVADEATVKALDYNRRIFMNGIEAVKTEGVWDFYILGSKDHPEAIKLHRNTKEVRELSDQEGRDLMEQIAKEKAEAERAEAAKQALESRNLEEVNLGIEETFVVDEETGELVSVTPEREKREEEEETPAVESESQADRLHKSGAELEATGGQEATQNFSTLAKSKQWRKQIREVLKKKWPDAPSNMTELEQFLRDKNVPVDAIGTSDADVQAWIKTIEECR